MLLACVHKPGGPHKRWEKFFSTRLTLGILEVGELETWMADSSFVTCAARVFRIGQLYMRQTPPLPVAI